MKIFRQFKKSRSLRIVNILSLTVIFSCLLLSYSYVRKELSYDHYHQNADRVVRLSLQKEDQPVDGRIYGNAIDQVLSGIPEIGKVIKLTRVNTAVLEYEGKSRIINDIYYASSNLFDAFDITMLSGEKDAFQSPGKMIISERFARQILGDQDIEQININGISITGRQLSDTLSSVSGIFKDIPENSHFHTDVFISRPDNDTYNYVYLLLKHHPDLRELEQKITQQIREKELYPSDNMKALLIPLTDIHLHSHVLREMEINGNIYYIYLIVGANLLLLTVVLFNVWLNTSLIFSYSRRYYQLLRLNGASSFVVVKDEALLAFIASCISLVLGALIASYTASSGLFRIHIRPGDIWTCSMAFLVITVLVSLIPVVAGISTTLFLNDNRDTNPNNPHSNIKYLLTAQYAIVMLVIILAFGISKQMNMVKETQVGGDDHHILVLREEQPEQILERYDLLKSELMKHSGILSVTSAMQLPGDAIRDIIQVSVEDQDETRSLPLLVVGEDFLPFYGIRPVSGELFSPGKLSYHQERQIMLEWWNEGKANDQTEEYMINRKALAVLGFNTPEDAIGKTLHLKHSIDYINKGRICGVTDDFNYTGLYETSIPVLMLQRRMFLHCIMVRFDPDLRKQATDVFNKVWNEVNPDFPAEYTFMKDVYGKMYQNELNAEKLIRVFSLLCLVVANLGLIIFMAYMIRKRTKEIGIRKVNGATIFQIIRMLNISFIRWIALSFVIAVPIAYFVLKNWLENFAYRTSVDWWIFALAGLTVLVLSLLSVSMQSWKAATTNPIDAIKAES